MIGRRRADGAPSALRSLPMALGLIWHAGRGPAAALVLVAALSGLAPVAAAWLLKVLVDRLGDDGPQAPSLAVPIAGLAVVSALALLLPAATAYLRAELERRVSVLVLRRMFTTINGLPGLRPFEDPAFHNQLRLAQQGGETAPQVVLSVGVSALEQVVTLVGFATALLVVRPVVALLALGAAIPALVVERRLSRRQADLAFTLSPHDRRKLFYGTLQTDERAAKELRLLGLGGHFLGRMLAEFAVLNDGQRRMDRVVLGRQVALGALAAALGIVGLVVVAGRAADGALSTGDVLVVVAAIGGVQTSAVGLVASIGHVLEALHLLTHFRALVGRPGDLDVTGSQACPPLREGIELRDVWFRYSPEHPWILRGLDLWIPADRSLALVGLNGAGKSTVVKLLCRLYDPERGAVLWDGQDLRSLDLDGLRRRIGTVFQDFMEYDLTAAENVGLGAVERLGDRDAVRAASRLAGVDGVLDGLPRGYDTMLSRMFAGPPAEDEAGAAPGAGGPAGAGDGDGVGVELSGGQWQRIAIARMLMRADRDLLVLDEPSAGLDAEAEHDVHRRLVARRAGTTSLLISHRLSAVAMADEIAVLSGGRVAERGTHGELIAAGGEYARLFELQASGYRIADGAARSAG